MIFCLLWLISLSMTIISSNICFFSFLSFPSLGLVISYTLVGRRSGKQRKRWMASPTQWTWVWVNSGSWCCTGRSGVLRFMGSQRVGHDWATKLTDWHFSLLNAIMKIMDIPLWFCSIFSFLYSIFVISIDQSLNSLIVSLSAVTLAPTMTWTVE